MVGTRLLLRSEPPCSEGSLYDLYEQPNLFFLTVTYPNHTCGQLVFVIPSGDPGPMGPPGRQGHRGPKGEKGEKGTDICHPWGELGQGLECSLDTSPSGGKC